MTNALQITTHPTDEISHRTIDRECMAEMWRDSGEALFIRLTKLFEGERDRLGHELQVALAAGDRDSLARAAHGLKTAAAYICAARLRTAAIELERAAPTADAAKLQHLISLIVAESIKTADDLAAAVAEVTRQA